MNIFAKICYNYIIPTKTERFFMIDKQQLAEFEAKIREIDPRGVEHRLRRRTLKPGDGDPVAAQIFVDSWTQGMWMGWMLRSYTKEGV